MGFFNKRPKKRKKVYSIKESKEFIIKKSKLYSSRNNRWI